MGERKPKAMAEGKDDTTTASILTDHQRKALRGEIEVEGGSKWSMHSRIRDRLKMAFKDFELLYENYDEIGLESVFDTESKDEAAVMVSSVQYAVALFYRGFFDSPFDILHELEQGCYRAERDGNGRRVGFNFNRTQPATQNDVIKLARMLEERNVGSLRPSDQALLLETLGRSDINLEEAAESGWSEKWDGRESSD
jgi:hypothetical protein